MLQNITKVQVGTQLRSYSLKLIFILMSKLLNSNANITKFKALTSVGLRSRL